MSAEPNNLQKLRARSGPSLRAVFARARRDGDMGTDLFCRESPSERLLQIEARKQLASLVGKESRLSAQLYTWQRRLAAAVGQQTQTLQPDTLMLGLLVAETQQQAGKLGDAEFKSASASGCPMGRSLPKCWLCQVLKAQRKLEEAIAVLKQAASLLPDRQ